MKQAVRMLARLVPDVDPLRRYRDFRIVFSGQAVNSLGTYMTELALPYQLYVLTHSVLAVGGLAGVQMAANVAFAAFGGVFADAMDRRRLLMILQVGMCLTSVTLASLALTGLTAPWHLFVLGGLSGVFSSVDRPTRQSLLPRLVERQHIRPAIALNQSLTQTAKVLGPGVAGLVIASFGVGTAYCADVASFFVGLIALGSIAAVPPEGTARPGLHAIAEGLRYIRQAPVVLSGIVLDLNAMLFGMPSSLFPAFALDVFHVGPQGLGLLTAAPALGGVVGALTSGWTRNLRYPGRVVFGAVAAWGLFIALFGAVQWFPLALVFLVLAGLANSLGAALRWTITQVTTPDRLRGRISALSTVILSGGPKAGDLEASTVAALTTPQISAVSGGLAAIAGTFFVLRFWPGLVHYDAWAPEAEPASEAVA